MQKESLRHWPVKSPMAWILTIITYWWTEPVGFCNEIKKSNTIFTDLMITLKFIMSFDCNLNLWKIYYKDSNDCKTYQVFKNSNIKHRFLSKKISFCAQWLTYNKFLVAYNC